jgi:hypothetical protein
MAKRIIAAFAKFQRSARVRHIEPVFGGGIYILNSFFGNSGIKFSQKGVGVLSLRDKRGDGSAPGGNNGPALNTNLRSQDVYCYGGGQC